MVADDLIVTAVGMRPTALEGEQMRDADEEREAGVEHPHPQAVADQSRGDGVEHLLEPEAARRGDADGRLLVVAAPPSG
jgi:hypothetical protein